ncbi:MAG: hypothetical protein QM820_26545 [Minicystis sp.]
MAWADTRTAPDWQVLALTMDGSGAPVALGKGPGEYHTMPAAPAGDPAVIAWVEIPAGGSTSLDITGTRLGKGAQPLDPEGLAISAAPGLQSDVALASDGETVLAVYADERPSANGASDIRAARVKADGSVLDPDGLPVAESDWYETEPSVAFGKGVYLVAWANIPDGSQTEPAHVRFTLVTPDGKAGAATVLDSPNPQRDKGHPRVAFDGERFLVVWEMHEYEGWNIRGTRITPAGEVLDPKGFAISNAPYADTGRLLIEPSVVFAGGRYVVGWQDEFLTRIEIAQVGTDGAVLDPEPLVIPGLSGVTRPRLGVVAGGRAAIAYERFQPDLGAWRIVHRTVDPETPIGSGGAGGAGGGSGGSGGDPGLMSEGGCGCRSAGGDRHTGACFAALFAVILRRRRTRRERAISA